MINNNKKKTILNEEIDTQKPNLKVASAKFLLVSFVWLKESAFETRKNVFYFTSFRSWDNQILIFETFKYYDVIKYLSMKHETHFTE